MKSQLKRCFTAAFMLTASFALGNNSAYAQDIGARCDAMARHAGDKTTNVSPTSFSDLKTHADEAVEICRKAHETGESPRYTYQYARSLLALGDEARAWALINRAADNGHVYAKNRVANAYAEGRYGVRRDIEKALRLYELNASEESFSAISAAEILRFGGGGAIRKDPQKAYEHLVQAEKMGNPEALYPLGQMLERGEGVTASIDKAIEFYRRSIQETGYRRNRARFALANALLVKLDKEQSVRLTDRIDWISEAYRSLSARAQTNKSLDAYDDLVAGIVQMAYGLTTEASRIEYLGWREAERPSLVALRGELIEALLAAHNDRKNAHPDVHSEYFNPMLAFDFERRLERYGAALQSYNIFRSYGVRLVAAGCIDSEVIPSVARDIDTVTLRLKNGCSENIVARGVFYASYVAGTHDHSQSFELNVPKNGQVHEFMHISPAIPDSDGISYGTRHLEACYARFGFDRTGRCFPADLKNDKPYQKARAELQKVRDKLTPRR